jgi:FkbM family methyltransferase
MTNLLRKARVAVTPRSWMLKRALSNGAIVCGRNRAGHGGRSVYLEGDAVEPELAYMEQLLPRDAVFVDIGANNGMYTVKAAKHLHAGLVIAVEPGVDALTMLAYNVKLNGLGNVRLRNLCIAEHTGEGTLWLNHDKPNAFSLMKKSGNAAHTSVLTVSLDDLCSWEGLTRLDYVKADVAGGEERILAGAAQTISRFRPIFQLAINPYTVPMTLPQYSAYQFPGDLPSTMVLIPDGDERVRQFQISGWHRVDSDHVAAHASF